MKYLPTRQSSVILAFSCPYQAAKHLAHRGKDQLFFIVVHFKQPNEAAEHQNNHHPVYSESQIRILHRIKRFADKTQK